jgi:hypothetical protein
MPIYHLIDVSYSSKLGDTQFIQSFEADSKEDVIWKLLENDFDNGTLGIMYDSIEDNLYEDDSFNDYHLLIYHSYFTGLQDLAESQSKAFLSMGKFIYGILSNYKPRTLPDHLRETLERYWKRQVIPAMKRHFSWKQLEEAMQTDDHDYLLVEEKKENHQLLTVLGKWEQGFNGGRTLLDLADEIKSQPS